MGGVSCGLEVTDRRAGDLEVREGEGQGDVEGGARMELWCRPTRRSREGLFRNSLDEAGLHKNL